jgi:putative hydrolase of the HAD superfamily
MIRALIFDLDDTLYPEADFLAGGFMAVAEHLSARNGASRAEIHAAMMDASRRLGRRAAMDAALERYPMPGLEISELVEVYRRHKPRIVMFPGYAGLLRDFRARYRIGIVTDGTPSVQRAKCVALHLDEAVDHIVYTWENGREREKPHPFPFRQMLDALHAGAEETLCVGDSLEKDVRGARASGMKCVRVQAAPVISGPLPIEDADFVVESLFQLPIILKQIEDRNESE